MAQENLPVISSGLLPAAQEFQMFQTIARSAKASGLYGGDENKIFMVLLAARELSIPPMLALNGGIWNIQGKIEISARLMNSMIRRSGHTMQINSTNKECTIKGKRSDTGEEHTETFTMEMAINAGLANGNVWKKYPEDMLYNRCMSRLARRLFPDVIGTAYVEGEIKEAKEIEKQELKITSYEDITPSEEICEKISQEQLDTLLELMKLADTECLDNMWKYLENTYKIESRVAMNIPIKSFDACIRGLINNIELKKKKNEAVA